MANLGKQRPRNNSVEIASIADLASCRYDTIRAWNRRLKAYDALEASYTGLGAHPSRVETVLL